MERMYKQGSETTNRQRTAQARFTSESRQNAFAKDIDESPAMVAQRRRLDRLFGPAIQRAEDEEPLQGKFAVAQAKHELGEEEFLPGRFGAAQRVEDESHSDGVSQKQVKDGPAFQTMVNRPEAIAQRKLQHKLVDRRQARNGCESVFQFQKAPGWYTVNKNANLRKNDRLYSIANRIPSGTKVQVADKGNLISKFRAGLVKNEHSWVGAHTWGVGWVEDSKLTAATRTYVGVGDDGMQQKLQVADAAIAYAQSKITHGPQNQTWARTKYGDEGDVNMKAMISLTNAQWHEQGGYNSNWSRPRRIGAAVEATGGGNCQDIAALTYNYLREHGDPSWTICFVVDYDVKHAFATIGDPETDNANNVVVADAWVQFPKAVTFQNHFCTDSNLTIFKRKQGGKQGRTATLMSKYWNDGINMQYLSGLKINARNDPTCGASWANNFPEGG